MKAPSGFTKCSICLSEEKLTFEHIIPESLGGFLKVDIQCAKCNNDDLGRKLVSKAKRTYTVRLAIHYLKKELPELFRSIEEGQEYSARRSDDISTTALFKKGKIISRAGPDVDGSIVVDQRDTGNNLKSRLRKEGFTEEQINTKLDEFNNLNIDQPFQISKNLKVIKRRFISLYPLAGDIDMDERLITLIAYNYLCITIGKTVYEDYFNAIREFIFTGTKTNRILIEQFPYNGPYKAYHKLFRETLEDRTKVTIVLFGSIAYVVYFLQLKIMTENNDVIIQELKNKKLYFALTIKDAKDGIYKVI